MSEVRGSDARWLPAAMQGLLNADDLTSDPLWPALSSGVRRLLLAKASAGGAASPDAPTPRDGGVAAGPGGVDDSGDGGQIPRGEALVLAGPSPRTALPPLNILVNDPGEDAGSGNVTQSEPSLAVRLPNIVVSFNDSTIPGHECGVARSDTGGASFVDEGATAGDSTADGVVAVDSAGDFFFSFLSTDAKGRSSVAVARSTDGGATFGPPVQASLSSNSPQVLQDKEWIAADVSGTATDRNLYVAWTNFDRPAKTAEIQFSRSTDHGLTWSRAKSLSGTGPSIGHHGAMPAVAPDGTVYVAWINRATGEIPLSRSGDGGLTFINPVINPVPGGTPVVATITQLGKFTTDEGGIQELHGGIRANSFVSIAVGPNGVVYIAVAAAGDGSTTPVDEADVILMRSTDRGVTWSPPIRVNDDTTRNDQWMPSVAVTSHGVVGVMFYDRRNDPQNLNIDVYLAMSWNDAATFHPAQRITTTSFPVVVGADEALKQEYMGDYNHMVAAGTELFMVWGDNRNVVGNPKDPNVFFAAVEPRPVPQQAWHGDFTGAGRSEVLFWAGDGNWWLGSYGNANRQLNWSLVGNPGWTSLNDGQHMNWLGDFTGAGRSEVLFWAGDGNWWLGTFGNGTLNWASISSSFAPAGAELHPVAAVGSTTA